MSPELHLFHSGVKFHNTDYSLTIVAGYLEMTQTPIAPAGKNKGVFKFDVDKSSDAF